MSFLTKAVDVTCRRSLRGSERACGGRDLFWNFLLLIFIYTTTSGYGAGLVIHSPDVGVGPRVLVYCSIAPNLPVVRILTETGSWESVPVRSIQAIVTVGRDAGVEKMLPELQSLGVERYSLKVHPELSSSEHALLFETNLRTVTELQKSYPVLVAKLEPVQLELTVFLESYRQGYHFVGGEWKRSPSLADSVRRALTKYPDLQDARSKLNQDFIRQYKYLSDCHHELLGLPDWPVRLADEVAKKPGSQVLAVNKAPTASEAYAQAASIVLRGNQVRLTDRIGSRTPSYRWERKDGGLTFRYDTPGKTTYESLAPGQVAHENAATAALLGIGYVVAESWDWANSEKGKATLEQWRVAIFGQ